MVKLRKSFVLILTLFAAAACSDDPTDSGDDINLSVSPDSLTLTVGQNQTVTATITGTTQQATFSSTNTTVATVDAAGSVSARAVGSTYIVAAIGNVRDSAKVVVKAVGPATLTFLGSGLVPERYTAEVAASGAWAYTTTWSARVVGGSANRGNALKIWNVTGNTPILSDSIIITGAGTLSDVQISSDGTLLAVSVESNQTAGVNGVYLYSRATPGKPTLLGKFNTSFAINGIHTVKLSRINGRNYAFAQSNSPALLILDITNPAAPTEVFSQQMGSPFIHDVFVRDGILFAALWHAGLSIFDVGGGNRGGLPSSPVLMGNVKTAACIACSSTAGSSVHNVWWFHDPTTGAKKYAFVGEEGPAGGIGGSSLGDIHVVDVSDFNNPHEVAFYNAEQTSTSNGQLAGTHNFDMDEASGVLYAAYYNAGVRALDVRGDLGSCTAAQKSADGRCNLRLMGRELAIAQVAAPTYVWGVKLDGNFLYASDMLNGIHKYNISSLKR
jgi:hypothetical protein